MCSILAALGHVVLRRRTDRSKPEHHTAHTADQVSSSNRAQDHEQTRSYMHAWRATPGLMHSELAKPGERLEVNINVDILDGATQRRELQVVQRQVGYLQLHLHAVAGVRVKVVSQVVGQLFQ